VAAVTADRRIHLCPIAGGQPRPIAESPPGEAILQWSADGRALLVGSTQQSHLIVVGSAERRSVVISRLDLRTGTRTPWRTLTVPETVAAWMFPYVVITPDGRSYAYTYLSKLDELYLLDGLE
jgi:hypothetical protein